MILMTKKYHILLVALVLQFVACRKSAMIEDTTTCSGDDMPAYNESHSMAWILQDRMEKLVEAGVPGVTLLIHNSGGRWIGHAGYSDLSKQQEMQACNIMRIASITKPMVISLAMHMHEQRLLNLDAPISDYLNDEISNKLDNAQFATLRQCMNHSSGIYDHIQNLNFQTALLNDPTKKWTEEELVKFAYGKSAYFPPGTSTKYSNINTVLVSLCINKVLGHSYATELRDFIFDPLGMLSTYYYSYEDILPQTTHGYFDLYGRGSLVDVSNYNTGIAHTAVYSTVYDLEKFLDALIISRTLLSDTTVQVMQDWKPATEDTEYGLGLFRRLMGHSDDWSRAGIGHTGGEFGYSGKMFYYPAADVTIISLCNYGTNLQTDIGDLYHQFHQDIERILMP